MALKYFSCRMRDPSMCLCLLPGPDMTCGLEATGREGEGAMQMQLPVTNTTHFDILLACPVFTLSFTLAWHPASALPRTLPTSRCHHPSVPTYMPTIR